MVDLIAAAWQAEEALLTSDVRRNPERVDALLAPDFYEIGQSGRRWNREATRAALLDEHDQDLAIVVAEREAKFVGETTVLLSYLLEFESRMSRRSALWQLDAGTLRCIFHQGTSVPSGV